MKLLLGPFWKIPHVKVELSVCVWNQSAEGASYFVTFNALGTFVPLIQIPA